MNEIPGLCGQGIHDGGVVIIALDNREGKIALFLLTCECLNFHMMIISKAVTIHYSM